MTGSRPTRFALGLLILLICLSPRIPLPISIPGRRFDLRFEDLLLVTLTFGWLAQLARRPRIYLTPLFPVLASYLAIVVFTSCVALMAFDLNALRMILYFAKEIEYVLIGLLIANWIRSEEDLRRTVGFLLFGGVMNAIWVVVQIATSQRRPLFHVEVDLPTTVFQHAGLMEAYGPNLIGEASPLSTGGFFLIVYLLALTRFLHAETRQRKWFYAALSALFFVSLVLSYSRVSILSAGIGTVVVLSRVNLKRWGATALALSLTFLPCLIFLEQVAGIGTYERFTSRAIGNSFGERVAEIWAPLLSRGFDRLLLGYGKGSLGLLPGLEAVEAHNHYLRVFLESGVGGLLAFLWLLAGIIALAGRLSRAAGGATGRIIGAVTLGVTVGLCAAALFQDAFIPVILNELWWVLIGLTLAAGRMEFFSTSREVVQRDA